MSMEEPSKMTRAQAEEGVTIIGKDTPEKERAVLLSLVGMAHVMCLSSPNSGVLEGLCQIVHHTLLAIRGRGEIQATPWHVTRTTKTANGDNYNYVKESFLYNCGDNYDEPMIRDNVEDWASVYDQHVLGRISLLYHRVLQGQGGSDDIEEDSEALFVKGTVEYRSPPSKGGVDVLEKEELSLTSFGGSVDDDVKLGALASLDDEGGTYCLTITSVRGKTYRYDVQSDGTMACVYVSTCPPTKLTKLELTLQQQNADNSSKQLLRPFSFPSFQLEQQFLIWDESPYESAMALPSRQVLLLDDGAKTYINGRYMQFQEANSLFGWNLHHIPTWHGRIQNAHTLKKVFATCWQEILIDARLMHLDIASMLLERLMYGAEHEEENVDLEECLESIVMASPVYDPVGICAKALATRFAIEFGTLTVPCLSDQVEWYKDRFSHKFPVVVPQRVLNVLRRGGYFDLQRETMQVWFTKKNVRPAAADGVEKEAVDAAMAMLKEAGCEDPVTIVFVSLKTPDPVKNKFMCRYNEALGQFHVNEHVFELEKPARAIALYVSQEHFDGRILLNLLMT
jgi:hypothetical protein